MSSRWRNRTEESDYERHKGFVENRFQEMRLKGFSRDAQLNDG